MATGSRRFFRIIFALTIVITFLATECSQPTESRQPAAYWPNGSGASQGVDENYLSKLTFDAATGRFGNIHSLLIVRNGFIIYENYFAGYKANSLHSVYSVTKSFASALIGLALADEKITNLDTTLLSCFAEYTEIQNMSEYKENILLRHCLQMRAGFVWDEFSTNYNSSYNPLNHLINSPDAYKFVLDLPMAAAPGSVYVYNSGVSNLLGGIIEKATGQTPEQYCLERLFSPMGIERYGWVDLPGSSTPTGFGLSLTTRDMAKFGWLYLHDGIWEDARVLSEAWIDSSVQQYTVFDDNSGGYGYQWWILNIAIDGNPTHIPYAVGWGGQYIAFIKPLNMVIAATAGNYYNDNYYLRTLMCDYIIPAISNKNPAK
jgi:CubicO group peptidase (beta-lactamase class C family)